VADKQTERHSDFVGSAAQFRSPSELFDVWGSLMKFIAGFIVALIAVAGAALLML
jgi:hypothetical protein